ncbi:hypothetical protein [Methylocystis echinoides]|uniref:hypothetical protein n=1 Tax=Methylocystis echinoides TaxID=29468 RepID=UPI00343374B3
MRFFVVAVAASLAAGGALAKPHTHRKPAAPAAATGPTDPNGSWSIEATTTVGECPTLIPSDLTVADNRIAESTGSRVASWGYVDETGNIVARFTGEGQHVVRFHGLLKGARGSGAWSSSTDMCGGVWRAERQKSALSSPVASLPDEAAEAARQR